MRSCVRIAGAAAAAVAAGCWGMGALAQEVGDDDFRISDMGPNGDKAFDACFISPCSDVAYNATDDEYLVVWEGDDDTGSLVSAEYEIWGQRLDAAGGEIGTNDFRISDMGTDGVSGRDAYDPAVVWNSVRNEYLVVWSGDDDTGPLVDEEFEIYGQRLDALGNEIGTNDFRISDMGSMDGNKNFDAYAPDVVYNPDADEYLVVWSGDDDSGDLVDEELEIWGQRLDGVGAEVGTNDFRISITGPEGSGFFEARNPSVAYDPSGGQYLVVWDGDEVDMEFEIHGRFVDAAGNVQGSDDFQISSMGPDGNTAFGASSPAVASSDGEYLVVWHGDDGVDGETEIYAQRIDALTGLEVGLDDFRLSHAGPDGNPSFDAVLPALTWNPVDDAYLVVWEADTQVAGECEIFGQWLDAITGVPLSGGDFRISEMGSGLPLPAYAALQPSVVANPFSGEHLVVWAGDDDTSPLVEDEFEIFGQRLPEPQVATGLLAGALAIAALAGRRRRGR